MFANCSLMGMDFGMPDVCLTPAPPSPAPIPVPYPNMSMKPMAIPVTANMRHLIMMMPSHNLATTIPTTMGDTTGVAGGVMSATMMGPARNLRGSVKVFTGGLPATRMLDNAMQNLTNVPGGMTLVPSQVKVLILT